MATPFDSESVDFLLKRKQKFIKVSSGDITNYPLLSKIGKNKKIVFLSTGMSNIKEIKSAVSVLKKNGTTKNIIVFHCTSAYPAPINEINLSVIKEYRKLFGNKNVGYSDHTISINVPSYAVLYGATVIEKHITQNNKDIGPDHSASLNIKNFELMVKNVREAELSVGSFKKKLTKTEKDNVVLARRAIYAKKNIEKGEVFTNENIIAKRPALGISPMRWVKIIGKKARKNFILDDKIII